MVIIVSGSVGGSGCELSGFQWGESKPLVCIRQEVFYRMYYDIMPHVISVSHFTNVRTVLQDG